MKKVWKVLSTVITSVLLVILIFGAGFLTGRNYGKRVEVVKKPESDELDIKLPGEVEKRVVTANEVQSKLVEIGELSTYSGEYTVTQSEDYTRYFIDDIAIPGTTNSIQIECQGIVKVGYDVKEISPTVDNESKKIYIALPEAEILDNYIIWDTVKCSENNTILNPIDFAQYQEMISDIEQQGLEQAENNGIYEKAESHVKSLIQNFLSGFDEFEIVFL